MTRKKARVTTDWLTTVDPPVVRGKATRAEPCLPADAGFCQLRQSGEAAITMMKNPTRLKGDRIGAGELRTASKRDRIGSGKLSAAERNGLGTSREAKARSGSHGTRGGTNRDGFGTSGEASQGREVQTGLLGTRGRAEGTIMS